MRQRKNKNSKLIGLTTAVVIASLLMMAMVSAAGIFGSSNSILLPMASAQGQSTTKTQLGTIASIQNGKDGKPAWVTSGIWQLDRSNPSTPKFNATFDMFMLNGSAAHKHTIKDFKITGSPTTSNGATTYNGTATVSLKKGPVTAVPISIKLMGDSAASIWVDPSKTENHFGSTPIYGAQHRIT
jgi:hypothetical protein